MIINIPFQRKETDIEPEPCTIEGVIELPSDEFQYFKTHLLKDYEFLLNNRDKMGYTEDGVRHCLLVLPKDGDDGILVDAQGSSYARYSAYLPNARQMHALSQYQSLSDFVSEMNKETQMVIDKALRNQVDGAYSLKGTELLVNNTSPLFSHKLLGEMLSERPEFSSVNMFDDEIILAVAPECLVESIDSSKYREQENEGEKIQEFNEANRPFYIVDHDDGEYSLCLTFSFLNGEHEDYGQEAFNAYAREIGEPVQDSRGFYTHGNGYEWEAAFRKAFENDPKINQIKYDCEAGGFFCYSKNLDVLKDFGTRFKSLVEDTEKFTKVVSEGIKAQEKARQEFEAIEYKIKGRLLSHMESNFNIRTMQGDIHLTPGDIKDIMDGSVERITVGKTTMPINDFLMQDAYRIQPDIFNPNTYQLITNDALEYQEQQSEDEQVVMGTMQM